MKYKKCHLKVFEILQEIGEDRVFKDFNLIKLIL